MSIRMTMERPFSTRKTPSHARRHRLVLFLAVALFCLCAGCARKQAALQPPAPQPPRQEQQQGHDIVAAARQQIGVPYKFGGSTPESGFDCSGFVRWAYGQLGVNLPRRAREQATFGTPVRSRNDLKPGDIVAFKGTRSRTGWHSGIYTGNGKFIHSPNKGKTVTEDSLDDSYYAKRYYGACRVPLDGGADAMYAEYQKRLTEQANAARATKGKSAKTVAAKQKGKAPEKTVAAKQNDKKAKAPENTAVAKQNDKKAKAPENTAVAKQNDKAPAGKGVAPKKERSLQQSPPTTAAVNGSKPRSGAGQSASKKKS